MLQQTTDLSRLAADWMVAGNYCASTCGRCTGTAAEDCSCALPSSRVWSVICSRCSWWSPHVACTTLPCLQPAALRWQHQKPQLTGQLVRPQRQHRRLPACLSQAALARAWLSCRRLRLPGRPPHQELRLQPQQEQKGKQLQPGAQQRSRRRRPPRVRASCCAPFMHISICQLSRHAFTAAR